MRRRSAGALALAVALSTPIRADPLPLYVSFDRDLSLETGAHLTASIVALAGRGESLAFEPLAARRSGRALRAVWALLVDLPVAWWFGVLQHEAWGHGGRAREFGASAGFHMGSPWEGRASYATFTTEGLSDDDLLRIYSGGSEANGWSATLLERELAGGGSASPLELMYVAASRLVVSDYVLRTTPHPQADLAGFLAEWQGGGDVANYLGYQHTRYFGTPGIDEQGVAVAVTRQYERLRRQARWNALDPGLWLSLYAAGRAIARGDPAAGLPLPRIGRFRVLPIFSADWYPEGGVASLEVVLGRPGEEGPRWFSLTVRRGRGPAGALTAVGAASDPFPLGGRARVGGEIEVWDRPDGGLGGGVRLRISPRSPRWSALFLDLGFKSEGSWPGRPAGDGPILRAGLMLPPR